MCGSATARALLHFTGQHWLRGNIVSLLPVYLYRKLTCPALVGVFQHVYELRRRVWSCRNQGITTSHRATLATNNDHQASVDDSGVQEEKEHDKSDSEQWNDSQSGS